MATSEGQEGICEGGFKVGRSSCCLALRGLRLHEGGREGVALRGQRGFTFILLCKRQPAGEESPQGGGACAPL